MENYNFCVPIFVTMVIPAFYLIIVLRNLLSNLFEPNLTTINNPNYFYFKLPYFGSQSGKLKIELKTVAFPAIPMYIFVTLL